MRIALLLGLLVAAAALASCTTPWEQRQRGGSIVLLVGRSPSTRTADGDVQRNARAVIRLAASDGARLLAGPVGRPADADWPADLDFALTGAAKTNGHEAAEQRQQQTNHAHRALAGVLADRTPRPGSNDLLAATAAAGRALAHLPPPKLLVITDDAHQMGSGLNVYRDRLTPRRIKRVLRRLHDALPDLRGVIVIIANGGLDRKARLPWRREQAIEHLWVRYWRRATHADRVIYDSKLHLPNR